MSCTDCNNYGWDTVLSTINPYLWGQMGLAVALTGSVIGAAWGIFVTGGTLLGASVKAPRIRSKNLVSVIFCEASAVYGVICAIFFLGKLSALKDNTDTYPTDDGFYAKWYYAGYALFAAGLCVGLSNFASGIAVGVAGASTSLADAQDGRLFAGCLIVGIFGSALAIFGLIVSILVSTNGDFPTS